jgi:hypothetical protein
VKNYLAIVEPFRWLARPRPEFVNSFDLRSSLNIGNKLVRELNTLGVCIPEPVMDIKQFRT